MVVAKRMVCLILVLTIFGCCYKGKTSEFGLPRKEITKLKFEKKIDFNKIDTMALYKTVVNFRINNLSKEYVYYEKEDDNTYPYVAYMKFYKEGKLGLFIIPKKDTISLQRDFFNPVRAKMGYYSMDGNSIKTRISTIGDCTLYISDNKGEIKNDTITLLNKDYSGKIYIKKKVSKELLVNWKPDW